MDLDPALIERGERLFWARLERRYEPGRGLSLDELVTDLPPADQRAVRAFLAAMLDAAMRQQPPANLPLLPPPRR